MRELERALAELRERAGTRDRDLDLLAFEIERDRGARPKRGREGVARGRARTAAADGRAARGRGGGAEAIAPGGDDRGVAMLLADAERLAQSWLEPIPSSTRSPGGSPPYG